MNVTRKNFAEHLPEILAKIEAADLVAIDLEFTGLPNDKDFNQLDTREERYQKTAHQMEKYYVLQYGLSIFNCQGGKYTAYTYNIFISPHMPSDERSRDYTRKFEFLASTMNFLAEHKFDFNTAFSDGVQYLTQEEEKNLKEKHQNAINRLKEQNKNKPAEPEVQNVPDMNKIEDLNVKALLEEYCKRIDEMLNGKTDEIFLPKCNYFVRRHIFEYLKPKYSGKCHFVNAMNEQKESVLKVVKSSLDSQSFNIKQIEDEITKVDEKRGFLNILLKISKCRTPIVFHAGLLDLLLTMKQFFLPALPPTLDEFKSATLAVFPHIFDTLLMVRHDPLKAHFLKGNSLGDVYKRCHDQPFTLRDIPINIPAGYRDYRTFGGQCHEAGFDAFMTGVSFIRMFGFVGKIAKSKDIFSLEMPIAAPFMNRIATNRFYDIHYISLHRNDKTPNREHCYHVSFPDYWRKQDIINAFSYCGHVRVMWINDTSAFVAIEEKQFLPEVKQVITNNKDISVQKYKEWRKTNEASKNNGSEVKRRKLEPKEKIETTKSPIERSQSNENGLKETIKETRKLQVFESNDMWE